MKHLLLFFLLLLSFPAFAETPCGTCYERGSDSILVYFLPPDTSRFVSLKYYEKYYKARVEKRFKEACKSSGLNNEGNYYCEEKGIRLTGNVYVTTSSNADFDVRITNRCNADYLITKINSNYASGCGMWHFVDHEIQADFTIRYVTGSLYDFTICFK